MDTLKEMLESFKKAWENKVFKYGVIAIGVIIIISVASQWTAKS